MHGRRWLIALGLSVLLTQPSRAEVDLSGVYLLRPDHPARYRVTQIGSEIRISSEEAFGTFQQGEVFFEGRLDQAAGQAAGSTGKVAGKYKLDGAWVAAVLKFQVGTAYRNFSIAADSGGKLLDTVHTYDPIARPPAIEFVDEQGQPADPVAGFSQPAPTVTLDPVTRAGLAVAAGVARFTLSGTVHSDLAEIVAGGRANITKVTVEYFSRAPDRKLVSLTVPVTPQPGSPQPGATSGSRRPFSFSGRFKTQVSVPLADVGTHVAVRATDVTGGAGYDSITIRVRSHTWQRETVKGTDIYRPAPPTADDIEAVVEGESTAPGVFNPIWVRIADPSSQARAELDVGAQRIPMVRRGTELYAEVPFVAVAGSAPGSIANIVPSRQALVVRSGTLEHKLGWATTSHSPPRTYSYAAGTEVTHVIDWDGFGAWVVSDVVPLRKEPRGAGFAWIADADNVTVVERSVTNTGARVRLRLGKNAWRVRDKGLQFVLRSRANPAITRAPTLGDYRVVPLRTVIVGVDGLGRSHAPSGATFSALFGDPDAAAQETALSALPTITWCNWAGIMTGAPPARHGILGNSFFSRDLTAAPSLFPRRPFNSDTRTTFLSLLQSMAAVVEGLDAQLVRGTESIYDALARATQAAQFRLNVYSVNMWYRRAQNARVTMHDGSFALDPGTLGHNPQAARALDRASGDDAEHLYRTNRDHVDVMTVYFPGPDNIAHDVGERDLRVDPQLYKGYTSGPALPEVTASLRAIGEHSRAYTDAQLKRLVDAIDQAGYLYATVFVLVADHGLHAYRNDDEHLVRARKDRGLDRLFDRMGLSMWTSGIPWTTSVFANVDNYQLVYAPNGGLAQLYVRNSDENASWRVRPKPGDVARVARQLYIEAIGGDTGNAQAPIPACTGNQIQTTKACFADLTRLGPPRPRQTTRRGALGSPPAIFVRIPHGTDPAAYRWLRGIDMTKHGAGQPLPAGDEDLVWGTIPQFLERTGVSWPAFAARLDEMNRADRSGDIVLITNGPEGFLAVNEGDELAGWHGGPEISESLVPLFFNIPGKVVNKAFVTGAVNAVKRARPATDQQLRNWQMGPILAEIYGRLYR
jgi:hypothetical protein